MNSIRVIKIIDNLYCVVELNEGTVKAKTEVRELSKNLTYEEKQDLKRKLNGRRH